MLLDRNIGISISDSDDLALLGLGEVHLRDMVVEFTRHLLLNHSRLIYGHDLRTRGYAQLFADLNTQYGSSRTDKHRCVNYLAWPMAQQLTNTDLLELDQLGIEVKLGRPLLSSEQVALDPQNCSGQELRCYWSKSLTEMRIEMTKDSHARVFIGGSTKLGKGSIPGVYEEAFLAIESGQPIYFIGALGGTSNLMINALIGKENVVAKNNSRLSEFEKLYTNLYGIPLLSKTRVLSEIKTLGLGGLSKLNGLSFFENERLFETPYVLEMVRLVLLGLKRILG